jgi:hypothetical protein
LEQLRVLLLLQQWRLYRLLVLYCLLLQYQQHLQDVPWG